MIYEHKISYHGNVYSSSYTSDATSFYGTNSAVTWNGAANTGNTAKSASVTVEKGAVWNLTVDSYLTEFTNNGTVNEGMFKIYIR